MNKEGKIASGEEHRVQATDEEKNHATNIEDIDEMYGCEIICCSSKTKRYPIPCMQGINNAKGALLFLCFALLMEGIINAGLFNAVVSTLERRFQFRSTESGLIASSFDLFTCVALLIITFRADKAFKPMWFGWGTFIMGVGCVLYSLPHFTAPSYSYSEENSALCGSNSTDSKCKESSVRNYLYFFFFANGLIGLGSTPLFTMAITYLDENVKQTNSALYNGIYYSMGALGPALGYLLGSALLNVYTDIGKDVEITSSSSSWVGAWWIGFLIIGILCMMVAFIIFMFPRYLPGTERYRQNRNIELHRSGVPVEAIANDDFFKSWKDAPKVIYLFVRNLPYVCFTLSNCLNFAFIYGFNTFGAKYVESIFGISTSLAALYFGIAVIMAAASGQFLGGYIVTKFKLDVKGMMKFIIVCTVIAGGAIVGFLMHCENQAFSGGAQYDLSLQSARSGCATSCSCNTDIHEPVCGADDVTYFSPCFAGCTAQMNETYFTNCSCVTENYRMNSSGPGTGFQEAKSGRCTGGQCGLFIPFIFILFAGCLMTLITTTPYLQATLRCVPFSLRTQALSFQRLLFTLLGSVPGRILSGKILDSACVSWGTECGEGGTCRAYDREKASKYMFILLLSEKVISLLLLIFIYLIYKPTNPGSVNEDHNISDVSHHVTNETDVNDQNGNVAKSSY